jgi:hypothetical protein
MTEITPQPPEEITTPVSQQNDGIVCGYCTKSCDPNDNFCMFCGYPLKGTDQEQKNFLANIAVSKIDLAEAEKKIKSARNYIYALSGFTLLSGIVVYYTRDDIAFLIVNVILSAIYGGLGYWANKKAFAAILSAMILYVTVNIFNAFIDPATLAQGVIFKVLIVVMLVEALRSSIEWEKTTKRITLNEQ